MSLQVGLSTHLFLEQVLDEDLLCLIRRQGISVLEIWGMRPHFDYRRPSYVARLAKLIKKQRMRVAAVHAPFYAHLSQARAGQWLSLSAPIESERQAALAECLALVDILPVLDCSLLVVHPGGLYDEAEGDLQKNVKESVQILLEHCYTKGIHVALENINSALATPQGVLKLLDELPASGLGMCLDLGHANLNGELAPVIQVAAPRLMHIHASDNDGRHDSHQLPLEGVIQWQKIQQILEKTNYQGRFIWELRATGNYVDILTKLSGNSGKISPFFAFF